MQKSRIILFSSIFLAIAAFSAHSFFSPTIVYSTACSDFNNDSVACNLNSGSGCAYPGNLGDCTTAIDDASCTLHSGCVPDDSGDCTTLGGLGDGGSACAGQPSCSYDSGGDTCTGSYFLSCSGTYDDGTCSGTFEIFGCTDSDADNFDPSANTDDGSCVYTHPPSIIDFTSTTANGSYIAGQNINIKAEFNKTLDPSSAMDVTLDTGATVTLDTVSGSTLSGTYTVGSGQHSSDLTVSSISNVSVSDTHSNTATNYSVPSAPHNLADTKNIVVVSAPVITAAAINGDTITLTYNDNVTINSTASVVVKKNGSAFSSISSSGTSGHIATIVLVGSVITSDTVTITYNGTTFIHNSSNLYAAAQSNHAVTNNTPAPDVTPPSSTPSLLQQQTPHTAPALISMSLQISTSLYTLAQR